MEPGVAGERYKHIYSVTGLYSRNTKPAMKSYTLSTTLPNQKVKKNESVGRIVGEGTTYPLQYDDIFLSRIHFNVLDIPTVGKVCQIQATKQISDVIFFPFNFQHELFSGGGGVGQLQLQITHPMIHTWLP